MDKIDRSKEEAKNARQFANARVPSGLLWGKERAMVTVPSATAAAGHCTKPKENEMGLVKVCVQFAIYMGAVVLVFGALMLTHNCAIAPTPWIPKSRGFCSDGEFLLHNYKIRNSLVPNFKITVESMQQEIRTKFHSSISKEFTTFSSAAGRYFKDFQNNFFQVFNKTHAYVTENYGEQYDNFYTLVLNCVRSLLHTFFDIMLTVVEVTKVGLEYGHASVRNFLERTEETLRGWRK